METPHPDDDPPVASQQTNRFTWTSPALGWGLACAICAGGVWGYIFFFTGAQVVPNQELNNRLPDAPLVIAFSAAFGGVLGALLVGLFYLTPSTTPRRLMGVGVAMGVFGGLLTIPTIMLCRGWLSPLASTTGLWMISGFLTGLAAYRLSLTVSQPSGSLVERSEVGDEVRGPQHDRYSGFGDWSFRFAILLVAIAFLASLILTIHTTRY